MKVVLSRHRLLPRPVQRTTCVGWLVVSLYFALVSWWCQSLLGLTALLVLAAFFAIFVVISHVIHTRTLLRLACHRSRESICTFARAFDLHSVDAAIVRAVYEELQHYFADVTPAFPFRPADRLEADFSIDPEDCEDLAIMIAYRTQRPLDSGKANPLWGKVQTVGDLVEFFTHQPIILEM